VRLREASPEFRGWDIDWACLCLCLSLSERACLADFGVSAWVKASYCDCSTACVDSTWSATYLVTVTGRTFQQPPVGQDKPAVLITMALHTSRVLNHVAR